MKKVYKHLPAILFVGFIVVMMVLFIVLPKKEYSSSEKRYLQQAPAFSFSRLASGDFGKDFEKFLSDQTAGRNFWVGLSSYYNYAIGNNGSTGIYLCRDGYLVNDPEDLSGLDRNIGFIEEFAEKCPVKTTVLIAPSTGYVCADILPSVHREYRDDVAFENIKAALPSADFVDIRTLFKDEYAAGHQLYYKTDHHWTTYGAYTAYRALAGQLGYTPQEQSAYHITAYPGFYGTTYSSSGFWMTKPDSVEVWDNPSNDSAVVTTITDGEVTQQQDMFYLKHLEEDDKYPIFLDGNHPYTVIKNAAASSDEKLLVIKDSFAHSLVPFLADHFSEIVMVDLRYYTAPVSELVKNEGIDRVLAVYSIDNLATDTNLGWLQ
ncbi:DHHW family protein [Ruminococcus sp.]|uniref:DHHW family protein n=1 Tax=Ruminococcus sp. TaxID=41978 RepID=UPI00388DBCA8